MIASRYNLVSHLENENYAIYNPLSGAFDIANIKEKARFEKGIPENEQEKQLWLERGYYFSSKKEEEDYIQERYDDFLEESKNNGIQFLLVLTYGCNFKCPYCYQKDMHGSKELMSEKMLTTFAKYVAKYKKETGKKVYVTLFGGEPLLPGHRKRIEQLVKLSTQYKFKVSLVTNGYYLEEYLDLLSQTKISEIQVTLDGDKELHNRRRVPGDGQKSFERILSAMKKTVELKMPLHVRLMIDRLTLRTLPSLAERLESEGFFDLPRSLFKTSLGRNYELIDDYMSKDDLLELDEMYLEYTKTMSEYPLVKKLHNPSYFGIRNLVKKGEMYLPSFDTCPAGKSEFVFDHTGKIYGCTASCGREGYELGNFYPELKWNEKELNAWKTRSILTIDECKDCSVGVVCGGGCGVIAKDRNGKVHSPNCKPIKNIFDIGIDYYKDYFLEK